MHRATERILYFSVVKALAFRGTIAIIDAQVESLMRGAFRKVPIDCRAAIANGNQRKNFIQDQIDQGANEQADQFCKRREHRADNGDPNSDLSIEIFLRKQVTATANDTIKQTGLGIPESGIRILLSAFRTGK